MFNIGDTVRCVYNDYIENQLTDDKTYTVININEHENSVKVVNDKNENGWYITSRFELVEPEHKTIILDGIKYYLVPVEE